MKLKKLTAYGIAAFFSMTTICLAEEIYIDDDSVSGYVEVDNNGFVEGFIDDLKGKSYFIEGEFCNDTIYDGFKFYDAYPNNETDFFDQTPEFEDDKDFFDQKYELYLEED